MLVVNTKEIFLLNLHQNRAHFPAERNAFVLDHQHGRRDVTCKPAITQCHLISCLISVLKKFILFICSIFESQKYQNEELTIFNSSLIGDTASSGKMCLSGKYSGPYILIHPAYQRGNHYFVMGLQLTCCLYGYIFRVPIHVCIIMVKKYIYACKCSKKEPCLNEFIQKVQIQWKIENCAPVKS